MHSRLLQSLPCARSAVYRIPAPVQFSLRTSPLTTASTTASRHHWQQTNTYATAANAAAAARAAAQRSAPRSHTRAPTPPPTKTLEEQRALGYVVRRTSSVQLPVYRKLKSGNTREIIIVKRVDGDRRKMVEDMKASIAIAAGKIRINPTTQHIELSGNYLDKTQQWLLDSGF